MAKTMTATQLTEALNANGLYPERVWKSGGYFHITRGYFYHMGQTAGTWAAKVEKALPEGMTVADSHDRFNRWPKASYLEALVEAK